MFWAICRHVHYILRICAAQLWALLHLLHGVAFGGMLIFALLRYAEQNAITLAVFKLLALIRDRVFTARKLAPAKLEVKKGNLMRPLLASDIELPEASRTYYLAYSHCGCVRIVMVLFIATTNWILALLHLFYLIVGAGYSACYV